MVYHLQTALSGMTQGDELEGESNAVCLWSTGLEKLC